MNAKERVKDITKRISSQNEKRKAKAKGKARKARKASGSRRASTSQIIQVRGTGIKDARETHTTTLSTRRATDGTLAAENDSLLEARKPHGIRRKDVAFSSDFFIQRWKMP